MTDDVRAATWICNSKKPPPTLNRRITSGNVDPCVNAACGQFIPWAIIMHEWSQADSAKVAGQEVDDQEIVSYRIYFRSIQYTQCKFTEKESRHTSINDTKNMDDGCKSSCVAWKRLDSRRQNLGVWGDLRCNDGEQYQWILKRHVLPRVRLV